MEHNQCPRGVSSEIGKGGSMHMEISSKTVLNDNAFFHTVCTVKHFTDKTLKLWDYDEGLCKYQVLSVHL